MFVKITEWILEIAFLGLNEEQIIMYAMKKKLNYIRKEFCDPFTSSTKVAPLRGKLCFCCRLSTALLHWITNA